VFFRGSGHEVADGLDGAASLADKAPDIAGAHGEEVGGLATLLTVVDHHVVRVFDELLHHIAQELVHGRINQAAAPALRALVMKL